jgi:hypothetical protein
MAMHENELEMVRASLPEYIKLARVGVEQGGLGCPTATLLFSVVDAIGSYHRKRAGFVVKVDGKDVEILKTDDHFRILNSQYFGRPNGLDLNGEQINRVYLRARCPVTHNAAMGMGCLLAEGGTRDEAVFDEKGFTWIHLPTLLERCSAAVEAFLAEAQSIIPGSEAADRLKHGIPEEWKEAYEALSKLGGMGTSVSVTGNATAPRMNSINPIANIRPN